MPLSVSMLRCVYVCVWVGGLAVAMTSLFLLLLLLLEWQLTCPV